VEEMEEMEQMAGDGDAHFAILLIHWGALDAYIANRSAISTQESSTC
jgi:hypothetical protein